MPRLRIAVVFGGRSVEHDVSVVTAHQVMAALSDDHEVIPVYITKEGTWLTSPALNDLGVYKAKRWAEVGEPCYLPPTAGLKALHVPGGRLKGTRTIPVDLVVPAVHGTYGEDGTLQGLLELADLPYTGSGVVGSAVGMDKAAMKAVFRDAGLSVLPHVLVDVARLTAEPDAVLDEIESEIGYPAFVKPARLGSSVGIGKGRDRASLQEALEVARRYDRRVLVEPALEDCIEVNCSVLGGAGSETRASVCEQPVSAEDFLSFSDKYMRDSKSGGGGDKSDGMAGQDRRIPAPISDELTAKVKENALRAFTAVDASGVARVDSFVREATGETWVMEINTVPGSFSFYLWEHSGLDFAGLMRELVDIALATHAAKSELMFSFDSGMLEKQGGGKAGG
jgi:D-alanine-D-alanine ligase